MSKLLLAALLGFTGPLAMASSQTQAPYAWDYDSCMENSLRVYSCQIDGQKVQLDIESFDQLGNLDYKSAPGKEKLYGVYLKHVRGGTVYIPCSNEGITLTRGQKTQKISCQ